jgi:hypothetical protein
MIDATSTLEQVKEFLDGLEQDHVVVTARRHLEDLEFVLFYQLKETDNG